jgi:hypothetical protein
MALSIDLLRIDSQRCPHLHFVVTKHEALWHHANDFALRIVESDRRADCAGRIIQCAVTQNSEAWCPALCFRFGKGMPPDGPDAKHVEKF